MSWQYAYTDHVTKVRAEIQHDAGALLDRLPQARLLTEEDRRRLIIEPRFEIRDGRDDRRVPLPMVPGVSTR